MFQCDSKQIKSDKKYSEYGLEANSPAQCRSTKIVKCTADYNKTIHVNAPNVGNNVEHMKARTHEIQRNGALSGSEQNTTGPNENDETLNTLAEDEKSTNCAIVNTHNSSRNSKIEPCKTEEIKCVKDFKDAVNKDLTIDASSGNNNTLEVMNDYKKYNIGHKKSDIAGLFVKLAKLLSSPTFVFLNLAVTLIFMLQTACATFLPKVVQNQFNQSADTAGFLAGTSRFICQNRR